MSNFLQTKTVVVVGGSSGIGFGVALAALQNQASLVIIASSNADRVANAVERLKAHKLPGSVRGEVLDAKDTAAVKDFATRLGAVDHVVWTSGEVPNFIDSRSADAGAFAVRFWGPFSLAHNLTFNEGGSLTFTGGPGDLRPLKGIGAIQGGGCASIEGLTKGLAVDLAPVRVNLVSPGMIETELWDKFPSVLRDTRHGATEKLLIKRIGLPDELAEAYIFLMKCGYITGQRINVDGGYALG